MKNNKPYVFANFVQTLDGKIQVLKDTHKYWPIGSREDKKLFLSLREKADTLIHGSITALTHPTLKTLSSQKLKKDFLYIVLTNHPTKELIKTLEKPPKNVQTLLAEKITPKKLLENLYKKGKRKVLLEGGAHTLGAFLKEDLVDEIYLTIAPKIVGNSSGATLTLVEGVLFPPNKIKKLKLLAVKKKGDELFLRYKFV